jgi:sirohydrochlorin cobaltochelatase
MQRKTGVLVFTHGSRLKEGNEIMVALVDQLRARLGCDLIEPCFMELGKPLIPVAIKRLIAKGCTHIFGYAFFLVPGSHLQQDIPFIFEQTLKKYPGVTYELSPPMMSDPLMVDFVAKHIEPVLGQSARK